MVKSCLRINKENGSICMSSGLIHQPKYIFIAGFLTGVATNYIIKKGYNYIVKNICNNIFKKKKN